MIVRDFIVWDTSVRVRTLGSIVDKKKQCLEKESLNKFYLFIYLQHVVAAWNETKQVMTRESILIPIGYLLWVRTFSDLNKMCSIWLLFIFLFLCISTTEHSFPNQKTTMDIIAITIEIARHNIPTVCNNYRFLVNRLASPHALKWFLPEIY